jgi:hypothetical protein
MILRSPMKARASARLCFLLLLVLFRLPAVAAPTLFVRLERSVIRENDAVPVLIWIENTGEQALSPLRLRIETPDFMEWRARDERTNWLRPSAVLALPPIAAHSLVEIRGELFTHSSIRTGSFTLLFLLDGSPNGRVSVEKTVQVSLLGSDTLGGVPLGAASLVIPGLLFFVVCGLLKVRWSPSSLADRVAYGAVLSVLLLSVGPVSTFLDPSRGIGIRKLGNLALLGVAGGLLAAGIDWFVRHLEKRWAARWEPAPGDTETMLLAKLIALNGSHPNGPFAVILNAGEEFRGSLAWRGAERTYLVGWFQVPATLKRLPGRQGTLFSRLRLARAIRRIANEGGAVKVLDSIKKMASGTSQSTGTAMKEWAADLIQDVKPLPSAGEREPLSLE